MATSNRILFFVPEPPTAHNDNHERLPAAFRDAGWETSFADPDTLQWQPQGLNCSAGFLNQFDKIWLLGLGNRRTFADRMQLLHTLPAATFVTTPAALLLHHGKLQHLNQQPLTFAGANADTLIKHWSPGVWVVKPTATSFATGVQIARDRDAVYRALQHTVDRFGMALLQRYEPAIERGELRLLFAGGMFVDSYLRLATPAGVTNVSQGASTRWRAPTTAERAQATAIAGELWEQGVGFCAVDVAGSRLIETNIANPGGLGTLQRLGREEVARQVCQHLLRAWDSPGPVFQESVTPGSEAGGSSGGEVGASGDKASR